VCLDEVTRMKPFADTPRLSATLRDSPLNAPCAISSSAICEAAQHLQHCSPCHHMPPDRTCRTPHHPPRAGWLAGSLAARRSRLCCTLCTSTVLYRLCVTPACIVRRNATPLCRWLSHEETCPRHGGRSVRCVLRAVCVCALRPFPGAVCPNHWT
jgi:hypothetical protein